MASDAVIQAAGGVLWRPSRKHGFRVALVHRPRYGDWSLPKGKADAGETVPVTAARELFEETGFRVALGRRLTTVSYPVGGRPKTVHYLAARCGEGEFVPNKEVDKLAWLPLAAAKQRATYEFDKAVLETFALEPAALGQVLFVRHARAGHRESYAGADVTRPLDSKGAKQAEALVEQLLPFAPRAIHSAPLERCSATVAPLADRLGLPISVEPVMAEDAYRDDPAAARKRLVELATPRSTESSGCIVVCSQGGVIPGVVKSLAGRSDVPVPRVGTPKASFWCLSFDGDRLVQADPYAAPEI